MTIPNCAFSILAYSRICGRGQENEEADWPQQQKKLKRVLPRAWHKTYFLGQIEKENIIIE